MSSEHRPYDQERHEELHTLRPSRALDVIAIARSQPAVDRPERLLQKANQYEMKCDINHIHSVINVGERAQLMQSTLSGVLRIGIEVVVVVRALDDHADRDANTVNEVIRVAS